MHTQFRARISYLNILLIVAEIHLKFNTHPNLCRTNSGPCKANFVSLSGHCLLSWGTQEILVFHFIYPSNYKQQYSHSSRILQAARIFAFPQHPSPFLSAQNYWHMSWLLRAFCAWQHSHPFISSQLGHLPSFLPFQILHTQNETNTNKMSSLTCSREINPFCQIHAASPVLIPTKIGQGFYLSIISL